MKKARGWAAIAFLLVVLSGCNQQQVADLILTVGFHPGFQKAKKTSSATTRERPPAINAPGSLRPLVVALTDLHELRRNPGQAVDLQKLGQRIQHVQQCAQAIAASGNLTAGERRQLREAELAALQFAANLAPAHFSQMRDSFRSQHAPPQQADDDAGEASALRILDEYLAEKQLPPNVQDALNLHSLSYPDCPLNAQLYLTLTERLTNEKQFKASIQVATDGIKHCGHLPEAKKLQQQMHRVFAEQPTAPGLPFQLAGPTLAGSAVDVTQLRGKVIVATFWASWCPGCRKETEVLRQLHQRYQREGVEFVGVSLDDDPAAHSAYLKANGITWPQIFFARRGQSRWNSPFAQFYKVTRIPFTVIIDAEGVISQSGARGEAEIESAILEELAKS